MTREDESNTITELEVPEKKCLIFNLAHIMIIKIKNKSGHWVSYVQ